MDSILRELKIQKFEKDLNKKLIKIEYGRFEPTGFKESNIQNWFKGDEDYTRVRRPEGPHPLARLCEVDRTGHH